ncbi:hypothetical protein [Flavobacterium alkalisoli]|uniref:hypothetical protein n=1 Tax=Flavobacterium alkalisoli TaxID=2602769 RepID=UPI003A91F10F
MNRFFNDDFSGGIDENIFNNNKTTGEFFHNVEITKDKKLKGVAGCDFLSSDYPSLGAIEKYISEVFFFNDYVFVIAGDEMLYLSDTGWQYVENEHGGVVLDGNNKDSIYTVEIYNSHAIVSSNVTNAIKIVVKDDGTPYAMTAGLPTPTGEPTYPAGNQNYLYYFVYKRSYKSEGRNFIDVSPFIELSATNCLLGSKLLENLPSINTDNSGAVDKAYDSASISMEIFRTVNNGTVPYYIGEVTNGATTFTDDVLDSDLALNKAFYYLDLKNSYQFEKPPVTGVCCQSQNCMWWLNDDKRSIRQSIVGDIDSMPSEFTHPFDEEINMIMGFQGFLIAFGLTKIYRVQGVIDSSGSGFISHEVISDGIGLYCSKSVVRTATKFYFGGQDGFYVSDGYKLEKIPQGNKTIKDAYEDFTNNATKRQHLRGAYNQKDNKVYWSVMQNSVNDLLYVYDENFDAFTTIGYNNFGASCLHVLNNRLLRADHRGFVFIHDQEEIDVWNIDEQSNPSSWGKVPLIPHYRTSANFYDASDVNKWGTKVTVEAKQDTSIDMVITSIDDNDPKGKKLTPIVYTGKISWGENISWGEKSVHWNYSPKFIATRRFKSGGIRFKHKQLDFTLEPSFLYLSDPTVADSLGSVFEVSGEKYVQIDGVGYHPTTQDWLTGYVEINEALYPIDRIVGEKIYFIDSENAVQPVANVTFGIKGYPTNRKFNLSSYVVTYDLLNDQGGHYNG